MAGGPGSGQGGSCTPSPRGAGAWLQGAFGGSDHQEDSGQRVLGCGQGSMLPARPPPRGIPLLHVPPVLLPASHPQGWLTQCCSTPRAQEWSLSMSAARSLRGASSGSPHRRRLPSIRRRAPAGKRSQYVVGRVVAACWHLAACAHWIARSCLHRVGSCAACCPAVCASEWHLPLHLPPLGPTN